MILVDKLSSYIDANSLDILSAKLGHDFNQQSLLAKALSHSSFCNEFSSFKISSNERLEFLGDAVIQLIISSDLFKNYLDLDEGDLSKFRSSLVNRDALTDLAKVLDLSKHILVGNGITADEINSSILSNSFEAIIGAIYIDGGLSSAESVFKTVLGLYQLKNKKEFIYLGRTSQFNPKSKLQEKCHELFKESPVYKLEEIELGVLFQATLYVRGVEIATCTGSSKKNAEKTLAEEIIENDFILLNKVKNIKEINTGVSNVN